MNTRTPTVSTVIAVYNGYPFVAQAIASALSQTYAHHEVIVVDDGSTDRTPEILSEFGEMIRVIRQPNRGVSAARNAGVAHANGDLVAFLDADDVWLPRKLERQVALFSKSAGLGFVYCGYFVTDRELRIEYAVPVLAARRRIERCLSMDAWGIGLPITGMVPRDVIEEVGGFSELLSTSADVDFLARIANRHAVGAVPEPLALYRTHSSQMHRDPMLVERDMTQFLGHPQARQLLGRRGLDRGWANLHLRVGIHKAGRRMLRSALADLVKVAKLAPSRLITAPVLALWRRMLYGFLARLSRSSVEKHIATASRPPDVGPAGTDSD